MGTSAECQTACHPKTSEKAAAVSHVSRRAAVAGIVGAPLFAGLSSRIWAAPPKKSWHAATFHVDVTPPIGHPLLAGLVPPAAAVEDPLSAVGLILQQDGHPVVLLAVDWCEIRNDAYQAWRDTIAAAVGTVAQRVLLASVHQHDAPLADLAAEQLLADRDLANDTPAGAAIIQPAFHASVLERITEAAATAASRLKPVTHVAWGHATVERIASNRRYLGSDGAPAFDRGSATSDSYAISQPEGTVDNRLCAMTLMNGDARIATLNTYATHPMSYYRTGHVSCDFPGLARNRMQNDAKDETQIYFSGAAGNVTAGKYNNGDPANRRHLTDRLARAMASAAANQQRAAVDSIAFRTASLRLPPRTSPGYALDELEAKLTPEADAGDRNLAALGLSWRHRLDRDEPIDVSCLDLGPVQFLLLPAEAYVEYQLLAQQLRPDRTVMVSAYGECGPGYIPTERARQERDGNLATWCWVGAGSEPRMRRAIAQAVDGQLEEAS